MYRSMPRVYFAFLLSLSLIPFFGSAQTTANVDLPSLESPYSTIYTHLYFLQGDSYQPAIAASTLYGFPDSTKAENMAIKIKQIFDGNGLFVVLESLPKNNDFVDSTSQKPYFTPFPNALPEVYLEKIEGSWYYSRETVSLVPQLHKEVYPFGSDILVNLFPQVGHGRFLGLAAWQYLGILILLILSWLVYNLLNRLINNPLLNFLSHRYFDDAGVDTGQIWKAARLLSILVILALVRMMTPALLLPIRATELLQKGLQIFTIVITVLFLMRLIDLAMIYFGKWALNTEQKYDEQLLPILKTTLMIIVIIGGIIQVLQLLNINVTALIAGLSIGGLALALAAQDTVKNLIGSAMVFIDRPFQIGDYIEWGGQAGTVVEVGFRTTRIRTGDTSIISVPNGTIANVAVTNKGMRVFRRFSIQLGVQYDTPPALIEAFVEGLRELAKKHHYTSDEGTYIHLNNMTASSLDVLFRVFLQVPGYGEELQAKEELLLGILRLAEVLDIRFAFPSSSIYVEQIPEKKSADNPYPSSSEAYQKQLTAFLADFEQRHKGDSV